MGPLSLYYRYLSLSLRAQLQYRASTAMLAFGSLAIAVIEFVGIWALFDRFGNLRGWTLPEVALLYGMIEVTFALNRALSRGLDTFPSLVAGGDFDRLLVRPRGAILQLLGRELDLRRVGRLVQGLAVLIWAARQLPVTWSPARLVLLLAAIAGGVCLFVGLAVVEATIAFWTVESVEIMNAFTDGGAYAAQYPMTIYRSWFRHFFTYVVPLACASYLPGLALLDRGAAGPIAWLAPLAGALFLLATLAFWRLGVRRYMSTGS